MSPTHSMIHYAQYCLHNLLLVSVHGVTLSHSLKHQCSHLKMPWSMKDSSDPLVMFVCCTCCHHWLCSIVVGCSLLESTIVPHQSALYGYHATNGCDSGVVCAHVQWQSFLVRWLGGVLSLGLAVSLVWAVVVVVEEMLCANSKVRLFAHDDLT